MRRKKFEHRSEPLLTRRNYIRRLLHHAGISSGVVGGSLGVGVLGYHFTEGQRWVDSLLNASMILGGMGPVSELHSEAGKLFASGYALFAGIVFVVGAGILLAPVYHRMLHRFHLELEAGDDRER